MMILLLKMTICDTAGQSSNQMNEEFPHIGQFYYTVLLHRFVIPFYYTVLLHRFITPFYFTVLLYRFITPFYYTVLLQNHDSSIHKMNGT